MHPRKLFALFAAIALAAARFWSFGVSFAARVASHVDAAGRSKNRRIELVAY